MAPAFPLISPGLGTTDGSLGSDVRLLDYSMRVWLDQTRLTNFGLTSKDVIAAATLGIFLIPMLYVIFQRMRMRMRMRERVGGASRTERLPMAALSEQHPKS
jgi:multidrug efflux pump subunit AcrB